MKRGIAAILMILTFASCAKLEYGCEYNIHVWLEHERNNPIPHTDVKVYAFLADIREWGVYSYENALEGRIVSRKTGEVRSFDEEAFLGEDGRSFSFYFEKPPAMIVVCDPSRPIYAYCDSGMEYNITNIELALVFRTYQPNNVSKQGIWMVVAGDVEPPGDDD